MTSEKKYLYLPLEIVVREHDGKVTLAQEAARAGWTVLIGPKLHLYAMQEQLPQGVFLIKSATPHELGQIRDLKLSGHKVFSLDEEGVVTFKQFLGNNVRYNRDTISELEKIFFWGPEQQKAFDEQLGDLSDKGCVSGSPRLEFWRDHAASTYHDKVWDIRNRYGRYVLIPSSFGIANNVLGGDQGVQLTKKQSGNLSRETVKFLVGQAEQNLIAFKEYQDFLPDIAVRFPDTNFIIRPHPSEGHEAWKDLVSAHKNFHLVYEGSVTPWILASSAIFHFKSTTSLEAHLMGVPAITYVPPLPPYMDKYELELPMALSHVARSRAGLIELMITTIEGSGLSVAGSLDGVVGNWISVDPARSAAQRLLAEMNLAAPHPLRELNEPEYTPRQKFRQHLDQVLAKLGQMEIARTYLPARLQKRLSGLAYGSHKYSGMDIEHTKCVVRSIEAHKGIAEPLHVTRFTDTVFIISSYDEGFSA